MKSTGTSNWFNESR